jgi:acyl carrier protein
LDNNPAQQGFELHHYDLVIASSVLHDVSDIRRTLKNLHKLLVPGGLVVILEETRFMQSFDLTMGLQQGFDVFTDTDIRQEHPLLTREKWTSVLNSVGFNDVEVMNSEGTVADYLGFDVFVAQMPNMVKSLDEEAVDAFLMEKLPAYMRPNGYQLIDAIPLNANGKIDYKSLIRPINKKSYLDAASQPTSTTEQILMAIWCEVLGCNDFGINNSFFDVGGDSLLLVEVRNKIKQQMQRHVPTTALFEHPTIATLATFLDGEEDDSATIDTIEEHAQRQKQAMLKNKMAKVGAV